MNISKQFWGGFIIGAVIIVLFILMKLNFFIKDDKTYAADDVFIDYKASLNNKISELKEQDKTIAKFINNYQDAIRIVDSLKFPLVNFQVSIKTNEDSIGFLIKNFGGITATLNEAKRLVIPGQENKETAFSDILYNSYDQFDYYFSIYQNLYSSEKYYTSSKDFFEKLNDQNQFNNDKSQLLISLRSVLNELQTIKGNTKTGSDTLQAKLNSAITVEHNVTENVRDKMLIAYVIPVFAIILTAIIFVPVFLKGSEKVLTKLLDDKILLQVFTIFILVITILLLGIGNKLSNETLGTLLGGISVYVLQKSLEKTNGQNSPPN